MRKVIIVILLAICSIICTNIESYADSNSYQTFNEIMMINGKLLANFTKEEMEEYKKAVEKFTFWGINVEVINKNIEATYISSTLYSVENNGDSDVSYELDVVVETSNKTTWSVSGDISGSAKGTVNSFKTDLAAKAGIDYSNVSTSSRKETQKFKVTVEKGSRAIVYLMGSGRVTNGVCSCYMFFVHMVTCGFEYFTLVNQYPRLEKRKL